MKNFMDRRKFVKKAAIGSAGLYTSSKFDLSGHKKPSGLNPNGSATEAIVRVVDLNIGEETNIILHDSSNVQIKLISISEIRDPVFNTLRSADVKVEINGLPAELVCGNYQLPVEVGKVQIDVPAVGSYMNDSGTDWWKLNKSARLRLWPAGSPWIEPGSFMYPIKQKWFASRTWFSNEPISPSVMGRVYYHAGMDIGAVDGLTEIIAATDGKIIALGEEVLEDPHPAANPRYDVLYIEDRRGWIYRYSHLSAFDPGLQVGEDVKMGQRLGYVGKEGASGGWAHLHFHIECLQPSGMWGIQDSYAFLWQSYLEEYNPKLMAVARPHVKTIPGKAVVLDGSHSWAASEIVRYEWQFMDGETGLGRTLERAYEKPGTYSEILKIEDKNGNIDYDFMRVAVYPMAQSESEKSMALSLPGVHVAYYPTFDIRPGDPVIFRSRGFGLSEAGGVDVYDFGDDSPSVEVPSNIDTEYHVANGYGMVVHHYEKPGDYIVRVQRTHAESDYVASQHLHVKIES